MQLPPSKPQFLRGAIHLLGNFEFDLGAQPSCSVALVIASAPQSAGEPKRCRLAVSYARRLGDAVDSAALLVGRSEGEAELLLRGSPRRHCARYGAASPWRSPLHRPLPPRRVAASQLLRPASMAASRWIAARDPVRPRLPATADRSALHGHRPFFFSGHPAEHSTVPAVACR